MCFRIEWLYRVGEHTAAAPNKWTADSRRKQKEDKSGKSIEVLLTWRSFSSSQRFHLMLSIEKRGRSIWAVNKMLIHTRLIWSTRRLISIYFLNMILRVSQKERVSEILLILCTHVNKRDRRQTSYVMYAMILFTFHVFPILARQQRCSSPFFFVGVMYLSLCDCIAVCDGSRV